MNAKWGLINAMLRRTFGKDMVRPDLDTKAATLIVNGFIIGILEDMSPGIPHTIRIQLRCGLVPHDAAKVAVSISSLFPIMFGPSFDYSDSGELLVGDKAFEYTWGYVPKTIAESVFDEKSMEDQYNKPN